MKPSGSKLMYVELKTGYSDDGPAWIGYVKISRSGNTVYFMDHAFQKQSDFNSNYVDIENGDAYWISGVKRNESNRHPCGRGMIQIDQRAVEEFLELIKEEKLPHGFKTVEIKDAFPVDRINALLN